MRVILRQTVDDLGLEGDIIEVAKGYARNYLIPKGLALQATPQNIKLTEMQRKKIEARRLKVQADAEKVKERLAGVTVKIAQRVGEEEKLYGSVTTMDIAAALEEQGVSIDRKKILLEKPIKSLGEFEVPVKLHPNVTAGIKVVVVPEE
ncbi:MAG: 50S ribosomal protein L9 [Deltaproteobacteria bacterium]|nr:50S ribosomal protein L9 [Deltaproteobacteria bacterium]MBW2128625.1 50S ribosomal protein L9 [Deltaproteobacteria bacterium]MBW2305062.1 50S ribosomal protein L9 [Deltaproteobacteria bacterium]